MSAEADRPGAPPRILTATDEAWPSAISVRDAVMRTEALLRAHGVGREPAGLVALVLAEVLNNVTEHAFARTPPAWIRIELRLEAPQLELTIADEGAAMPDRGLPEGSPVALDGPREALPEGGFGWILIRRLTRDIRYVRGGGTNRLSLCFDLPSLAEIDIPV